MYNLGKKSMLERGYIKKKVSKKLEKNEVKFKPKIFKINTWLQETKIKCYFCNLKIEGVPKFTPLKQYKNNIYVDEITCSFPCAVSAIHLKFKKDIDIIEDRLALLSVIYDEFYNILPKYLFGSPKLIYDVDKSRIENENEYREIINEINKKINNKNNLF